MHQRQSNRAGLTLIELLVVCGIVLVLVAILIPAVMGATRCAERTKSLERLRQTGIGVHGFHDASGMLPTADTWQTQVGRYTEGMTEGCAFTGRGAFGMPGLTLGRIADADGTATTILLVPGSGYQVYEDGTPVTVKGSILVCMVDGSAHSLGVSADVVRTLITWNGGEAVAWEP